jgi:hypothetical protein
MARPIRVELVSRDGFWRKAVMVEWEHQFPARAVADDEGGTYVIEEDWLDDFARVAGQCFSTVHLAPADPGRRRLFRLLFAPGARG